MKKLQSFRKLGLLSNITVMKSAIIWLSFSSFTLKEITKEIIRGSTKQTQNWPLGKNTEFRIFRRDKERVNQPGLESRQASDKHLWQQEKQEELESDGAKASLVYRPWQWQLLKFWCKFVQIQIQTQEPASEGAAVLLFPPCRQPGSLQQPSLSGFNRLICLSVYLVSIFYLYLFQQ